MPCDESWIYWYDPETKRQFPVDACWFSQTQEGQTEQIHPQTFDDPFFDSTGMIYMHWVPTGQTVNKEYYVKVLREFRKRFLEKRPVLFKSGQWHFHQDKAPDHNFVTASFISSIVSWRQPLSLGNNQKSQGARPGLLGGWGTVLMPILVK